MRTIIEANLQAWERKGDPKTLAKGHGLSLIEQTFVNPKTGKDDVFTQFTKKPGFTVIPITTDGELILVRQFKQAVGKLVYEFPAGLMKDDEATTTHAAEELMQETGCYASRIVRLTEVMIDLAPRKSPSGFHLFAALGCRLKQEQQLDPGEDAIEVSLAAPAEVSAMIVRGEFRSTESVTAFFLAQHLGHFPR